MWSVFNRDKIEDIAQPLPLSELKKRVKIVVIDDEEDSFPTKLLQDDGYTLEWWPRLDAAGLHRLERGDYDIVVLDIQGIADVTLSDTGDGMGVLKRLKSVNPYQVIVAFSGKSYDLDSVPFWKLADETLRKPLSVIRVKEIMDRLIQDRVNIPRYWDSVTSILAAHKVPPKDVRRLEKKVVRAARKGTLVTFEQVKDVVGTFDALGTVFGIIQKIAVLWRILA